MLSTTIIADASVTYIIDNDLLTSTDYGYICEYVYLNPNGNSGTGTDTIELIFPSQIRRNFHEK